MDSNFNPASKRLKTGTLTDDERGIRTLDVAASASDGSKVSISKIFENVNGALVNIFTDDILPEIFGNLKILTTHDLLNFRLVNRCWRDSATSILLKRNLCQIVLNFGKVTTNEDGNAVCEVVKDWEYECQDDRFSVSSFKYFGVNKPGLFLEDLNKLISTSQKFPSASIGFYSDRGRKILSPPSEWPHAFPYQTDLLHFFSLYGMEIRKLSLSGGISVKVLQNLLYVHMPHLTCLDFHSLSYFFSENKILNENLEETQMQVCLSLPSTLKIKSISVGFGVLFFEDKVKFLKDLISVCPNLTAIYRAGEAALQVLIEMKKYHLIKQLKYSPVFCRTQVSKQAAKLVKEAIIERKLPNFKLSQYCVLLCDIRGNGFEWMAMNMILSASKNSLKNLELGLRFSRNILDVFVPPLPYLEYLELNDYWNEWPVGSQVKFVGDVIGRAIQSGELTSNKDVSDEDFKALVLRTQEVNNISPDYFPRLRKVRICSYNIKKGTKKLMGFFSLEHLGPDGVTNVPGDTVPTVTTLEFGTFPCDVGYMPQLFPNVSHLIVYCQSSGDLRNWVWTAFPKLQRLEISAGNFDSDWDAETVDCFFTGISQKSRENCYGKVKSCKLDLDTDNKKDFERTHPYIRDCENVKRFEIQFRGECGSQQFASAAVYGLQKATRRTKIILSVLSVMDPEINYEKMEETFHKLEPVTAYVEIRMNK